MFEGCGGEGGLEQCDLQKHKKAFDSNGFAPNKILMVRREGGVLHHRKEDRGLFRSAPWIDEPSTRRFGKFRKS